MGETNTATRAGCGNNESKTVSKANKFYYVVAGILLSTTLVLITELFRVSRENEQCVRKTLALLNHFIDSSSRLSRCDSHCESHIM